MLFFLSLIFLCQPMQAMTDNELILENGTNRTLSYEIITRKYEFYGACVSPVGDYLNFIRKGTISQSQTAYINPPTTATAPKGDPSWGKAVLLKISDTANQQENDTYWKTYDVIKSTQQGFTLQKPLAYRIHEDATGRLYLIDKATMQAIFLSYHES